MNHQTESAMRYQSSQIDQLQAQLRNVTEERDMYQRTTLEADTKRRQDLYIMNKKIRIS